MSLDFKNSVDAIAYGRSHKGDIKTITRMKTVLDAAERESEIMDANLKKNHTGGQDLLNLLCKCQFIREAIEEAETENKAVEPCYFNNGCAEVTK